MQIRLFFSSIAALALFAGCSMAPWAGDGGRDNVLRLPDLGKVSKIELCCSHYGGIPGAAGGSSELVLCKGGPCLARVTTGNNYNSWGQTTDEYELPAATFEECRQRFVTSDFLAMQDAEPAMLFENSVSRISVTCDGKLAHTVCVVNPAPEPKGFRELYAFPTQVIAQRGKLLKHTKSQGPPLPPLSSASP